VVIKVPFLDPKGSGVEDEGNCTILLPHDWIAALSSHVASQDNFQCVFGTDQVSEFWEAMVRIGAPQLAATQSKGLLEKADWKTSVIPLTLHQDGVAFQDRDSLDTLSFGGLLAEGVQTLDRHFLLAVWPKSCSSPTTWGKIWKWLLWSFEACLAGVHPLADPWGEAWEENSQRALLAGTPIIQGGRWRAVLFTILGDMKELQETFGLAHQAATHPCHLCNCNKSDNCYADFRPTAPWRSSAPKLPGSNHPIMTLVSVHNFGLDLMHVFDLGVTCHAIGNLLFDLVYNQMQGTREACWQQIWAFIQESYSTLNVPHDRRVGYMKLSNITNTDRPHQQYPMLHGLKAAEVRSLVEVAELLAKTFYKGTSLEHTHMVSLFKCLAGVYKAFDAADLCLAAAEHRDVCALMERFLLTYNWFGKQAQRNGQLRWSVVPKFHYAFHLVQASKYMNPKLHRCYAGEDFVGKISRLAHTCLPGLASFKLSHSLFEKYNLGMHLRITKGDCS
jgi:hypothetical protein